jgi:SAM-dependent methyltransferase
MQEYLRAQYRRRFEHEQQGRLTTWRALIDGWFSRYLTGVDSLLDLGCGWGAFVNQVSAPQRYAIDLNPDARSHLQDGVTLFTQPSSDPWPLPDASLDLVFTSNFLEHLPDRAAITATLAEASRCLRPGGRLVCLGPNVRCAPGAYWDFFDHVVPISERSLVEALELAGFEVDEAIARFLPLTMVGKPPPPLWAIRAYLRFRPAWRLLGRQFLVVARKPALAV